MLESTKILLEKMTESYPPVEGMRHSVTLNGDRLELNIVFNGKSHPILLSKNELTMPIEAVIDEICSLFDPTADFWDSVGQKQKVNFG